MGIRRQTGFTLIEIMLAVAILAIIAAIAIPLYQGYIGEARFGAAAQDIRQAQLILDDLASDNDLASVEPAGYASGTDVGVLSRDRRQHHSGYYRYNAGGHHPLD